MDRWKKLASEESIHACWHDPSSYDPATMGPPYLPPTAQTKSAATFEITSVDLGSVLASLLTRLLSVSLIHWTNHWLTQGPAFYGDHLLFERLYNETIPMVDALAERCVGNGGAPFVNPALQAKGMAGIVEALSGSGSDYDCADLSLRAVQSFLSFLRSQYTALEESGQLSHGTDNLLQDIADKHEGFVYLLQQKQSTYAR